MFLFSFCCQIWIVTKCSLIFHRNRNRRKMAEAVANVARRINATVEEGKDYLGKNPPLLDLVISIVFHFIYCSFSRLYKWSPYSTLLVWFLIRPAGGVRSPNYLFPLYRSFKLQAHFFPRWCFQGPKECLRRHSCYHSGWQWDEGYFQQVFFNLH